MFQRGFSHVLRNCRSQALGILSGIRIRIASIDVTGGMSMQTLRIPGEASGRADVWLRRPWLIGAALALAISSLCSWVPPVAAADATSGAREPLTVDAFSVVRVRVRAVPDARSRATLGPEREGTGIVIDSS